MTEINCPTCEGGGTIWDEETEDDIECPRCEYAGTIDSSTLTDEEREDQR